MYEHKLVFRPTRELSPDDLITLGRLGLVAGPGASDLESLSPEELLQEHLERTYPPKSDEDFFGKEHFWKVGHDIDVREREMAKLFGELCFPTIGMIANSRRLSLTYARPYEPSRFGLVVVDRNETVLDGIATIVLGGDNLTTRQILHKRDFGNALRTNRAAIQIKGIMGLAEQENFPRLPICTPRSRLILPDFCRRLGEITSPQLQLIETGN